MKSNNKLTHFEPMFPLISILSAISHRILQKQPPGVFYEKNIPKYFAKSTGKHLCQSLFFNKVVGLRPEFCEKFKNTFFTEHFWTTASEKSLVGWIFDIPQYICIFVKYINGIFETRLTRKWKGCYSVFNTG